MRSMKNVTVFTEDGAFALFFRPHPRGFDSSRVPTPGNLPSKAKKMLMPRGQSGGGGTGHSWNWLMHYRRGLQTDYNTKNLYQAEKPSPSEPRNHQTLTWTNLSDDEPVPCKRDNWDQSILVLQKLWLETMTMKVSVQKSQKTLLIAVNFITSENENCVFLPDIFVPMRRDLPQITFQRSMTHTACVACGPKTTDFSRFPEKRHSTKVLEHLW